MIYTCTTNPSLDYFIDLNELVVNDDNRSNFESYDAGGKGVNVSIVLNNFHIPSTCLGFLGGFVKDYYLTFISKYPNIQPLFTSISDNTRINIKIKDLKYQTDINTKGPHITNEEFEKFHNRLNNIYTGDYFVLSGNIEEDIIDKMIDIVHELASNGVRVILDCDRDIIERCIDTDIFAVKLNDDNVDGDILTYSNKLIEKGVKYVIYSAANKPSYIVNENETLKCENLVNSLINVTGSSDSLLAGFIYGIIRGADIYESFKYANAASLATNMSNDLGSKEKIEEVYNEIEVIKLWKKVY